ncbi:MAG: hypothetical protein HRF51_01070 [bacterium]
MARSRNCDGAVYGMMISDGAAVASLIESQLRSTEKADFSYEKTIWSESYIMRSGRFSL